LENVEFAAYFDETGYVILSAFDVSAMNPNIAWGENHQLGFEISVNDSVEAGVRSTCIGWADETDNAYQDNTCLGVVYLVKNGDSDVPSGDASVDTDASAEAAESEEAAESTEATESTETTESEAASEATSEAVSEKAESEAPASSIADTSDSEGGFPIWIIIVIAAVVVVAVVVVVVMKKK
jgi:cobalamin biosynthesis Mg chelatase CobN